MKYFKDLKIGDEVFVIYCGKCYKVPVTKDVQFEKAIHEWNEETQTGRTYYEKIDNIADASEDDLTECDRYKVHVTIKEFDENRDEKEWTFTSEFGQSAMWSNTRYSFYIFSDYERIKNYRDNEYRLYIKEWDDILENFNSGNFNTPVDKIEFDF